jgi:hypothetical protein
MRAMFRRFGLGGGEESMCDGSSSGWLRAGTGGQRELRDGHPHHAVGDGVGLVLQRIGDRTYRELALHGIR